MTALIFFCTIIAILFSLISVIIKAIRHKRIAPGIRTTIIIIGSYFALWVIFYLLREDISVPLGTDICFDDWCATITKIERAKSLENENMRLNAKGQFIILQIKMSNHARGIAQKPSEPRIHLIDGTGTFWAYSEEGQKMLEKLFGKQIALDEKLKLHESLETKMVFDIPIDKGNWKALIEEGPFITKLLFNEDRKVFLLN
jgi:hypothetical protein